MATLADMKARIAAEIFRSDLTSQIAAAISDAIGHYQNDRFWFNEPRLDGEPTFNTVAGIATYGSEALDTIGSLFKIDYLTYVQGNATFKIYRETPENIQLLNQNGQISGPPDRFCFAGQAITLYPRPNTVYPISIFGELYLGPPLSDTDPANVWMNEAENLIRSRAKYELAVHVTKNATLMQLMSPFADGGPGGKAGATYDAYANLKATTTKRVSLGRILPMQF